MVSDTELAERLQEILKNSDLETATPGSVRRQLEEEFGVDLSDKKAYLRGQIDLFIDKLNSNADGEEIDVVKQNESDSAEEGGKQDHEEDEDQETEASTTTQVKKKRGGFSIVCCLSPKLQAVVGEAELPRTQVVKKMWVYIRDRNLQDPTNRRNIVCDDALKDLFKVKTIDMFQMNKALSKHIWPLDSEHSAQSRISDDEEAECSLQDEMEKKERKPRGKKKASNDEQNPTKKRGGFNKLYRLSPKLQELTGAEEMGRSDVVKHLWEHIRANNLQDPTDKRRILCDESLRSLFKLESIGMFQMNKELTAHLLPIDENASKLQKLEKSEIDGRGNEMKAVEENEQIGSSEDGRH